jgi:hypothetical protein
MPLRRRDPALAAAQRIVRDAFEDLEKTVSPADSKDFEVTTLENVQKAALEIENQLAARQSLRNMRRLMPLFSGLGYYAQTIEVLCNGTPYLPWIWAPIKIILKVSGIGDCVSLCMFPAYTNHRCFFLDLFGLRGCFRADCQGIFPHRRIVDKIQSSQ